MSAQQTLLEMVQDILGELVSDEITSIDDTEESRTVAKFIRRTYFDLSVRLGLPEHEGTFNLDETDADTPIVMARPADVRLVQWVRYEKHTLENENRYYERIKFVPVKDFLDIMYSLVENDDNVDSLDYTVDDSTFTLLFRNDKHPEIYTTFDDNDLVFDSYNSDVDAFLTSDKTLCYGAKSSVFTLEDSFIPDLEEQHFPLLVGEAAKLAFDLLKDRIPESVGRNARQLKISAQRTKPSIEYGSPNCDLPNYGRR